MLKLIFIWYFDVMLCLDLFLSFFDLRDKAKHMPLIKDNIEMCELCSIAVTGEFHFCNKGNNFICLIRK